MDRSTKTKNITILMMIEYGDRTGTHKEVCYLFYNASNGNPINIDPQINNK